MCSAAYWERCSMSSTHPGLRLSSCASLARLKNMAGQSLVVKLGGEVMLNTRGLDAIASQISTLVRQGVHVVVVHGGGPQADALAQHLGYSVRKVAGRRVTDDAALEVAKMVYGGSIN